MNKEKDFLKQKTKILHSLLDKIQESTLMACSPGLKGSVVAVPCCHHLANKFTTILTKLVVCCKYVLHHRLDFPFFLCKSKYKCSRKNFASCVHDIMQQQWQHLLTSPLQKLRCCRGKVQNTARQQTKETILKNPPLFPVTPTPPPPVEAVSDAASRLRRVSMFTYNKADIEILCATS